ncbi:methyltransferase domain-containing protein [bacterium]|nr:methyltransferase domain-containing protein [bacterium]
MTGPDPLYFEKLGENWNLVSQYDLAQRIRLIFTQLMPAPASPLWKVLEVGCGVGFISRPLVQRFPDLTVNDISGKLTSQVSSSLGCHELSGDCCDLVPQGIFDLVVSSEAIEHSRDPYLALRGMAGMLKPGGWMIVTTPNKLYYPLLLLAIACRLRTFEGSEIWTWPWKTRQWLRKNGFTQVNFSGCHLLPWQVPGIQSVAPTLDRLGWLLYPVMVNYGFSAQKIS